MSAPSRSLQDTVIVVTGAGGGIGGATARLALEAGDRKSRSLNCSHDQSS